MIRYLFQRYCTLKWRNLADTPVPVVKPLHFAVTLGPGTPGTTFVHSCFPAGICDKGAERSLQRATFCSSASCPHEGHLASLHSDAALRSSAAADPVCGFAALAEPASQAPAATMPTSRCGSQAHQLFQAEMPAPAKQCPLSRGLSISQGSCPSSRSFSNSHFLCVSWPL